MNTTSYIDQKLYNEVISNSNVINGDDYRNLICAISQVASDMVVKTLGPYGSTTVIDEGTGFTYPTKDGWSCLNKLQFTDPTYNSIYSMLKKISFNSVTTVGDGTTTAMVAANNFLRAMYTQFIPSMRKSGFRQADFIETMNEVYIALEKHLKENDHVQHIDIAGDFSDIYKVAYIATNGNHEFAKIIQEIYQKTGNPNIQVTMDKNSETTCEIQQGYKFDARVLNFPVYVNNDSGIIDYTNSPRRVVIFDHTVTFQMHETLIGAISSISQKDNVEIIIMAPYFDDIVTSWIDSQVQRMAQQRMMPSIMLVQLPMTAAIQRKSISDMAVLVGAQIFDEAMVKAFNILYHNQTHNEEEQIHDSMMTLEKYIFESPEAVIRACLGTIKSVILNKNEGFLKDYEDIASPIKYKEIMEEAKVAYESEKSKALKTIGGTLDKDFLFNQMRYIKLKGSTGVIKVGAFSDIQQRCDKDSLDDAVLACRSAFENGYVRGMNLELLSTLYKWINGNIDDRPINGIYAEEILTMLYNSFYATSLQVIMNKYPNNEASRLVKYKDRIAIEDATAATVNEFFTNESLLNTLITDKRVLDYNLRTEETHSIGDWEVINSTSTDIEIIRAVVNILTTIITSNQFLSVTRRFDPIVNNERTMQNRLEEDRRITANKVHAFMDALADNENYDLLQGLIGGVHVESDDLFNGFSEDDE